MSKTQGTVVIALLIGLLAIAIHADYLRKRATPKFEYRAADGEKIDLGALQSAGSEGWDCTVIATGDAATKRYVVLCKRPVQ